MSIPYICLFSGEDGGQVPAYEEALNGNKCGKENFIEHFGDMHHGWMGARARLGEEKNKKEYERGYDMAGAFFRKNLYM
jgi:dienelactone hydrolase